MTDNGPPLHDELLDLERRLGLVRRRAQGAGLLALDEALREPHAGLRAAVEHVEPSPSQSRKDPMTEDKQQQQETESESTQATFDGCGWDEGAVYG